MVNSFPSTSSFSQEDDSLSTERSGSSSSFSKAWAIRYMQQVNQPLSRPTFANERELRAAIAKTLHQALRPISAKAWNKTEQLLSEEVVRHQLDPDIIDPWAIAGDVFQIFDKAFESYASFIYPERFAVSIAPELGHIRAKFTAVDPRVIGFVSMQFHYTGQLLLELLEPSQRGVLELYFKAIDDHLYMPLQRAYDAASNYPYASLELRVVRTLLPKSSSIAQRVVAKVSDAFPNHQCYSGPLKSPTVRTSSTRDAEMFQTYLWVCLLEKNPSVVQQELFPLCVMLYPTFNVNWELVRYMLKLLQREVVQLLSPSEFAQCAYHFDLLETIFSPEVTEAKGVCSEKAVATA
ncbi:hypothetical protein N836_26790 [Leptolyngbya sp. Heron Island J]|uniref:hypothetical protein n=1 Tax=Leptolyngbya sp. Heron Island J TaxID=1385935 RepID=UPI0003B9A99E|nr:hypothetical protein [Leptolyngbya sp. Heron Island J]ESA32200.1 hypothetical protein N836_26790 [Leptolyngbya sp. Heron Island J]